MRRKNFIILLSSILISISFQVVADQRQLSKLKGIDSIEIEVYLDDSFKKETGLSETRIENMVAVKFKQSGIKVTKDAMDIFSIQVSFAKAYCCATYIETTLTSPASLKRNDMFVLYPTWKLSTLYSGGVNDSLNKKVLEEIESFTNEFLNLYLEANPRQFFTNTNATD